jgi:hypothetical protein
MKSHEFYEGFRRIKKGLSQNQKNKKQEVLSIIRVKLFSIEEAAASRTSPPKRKTGAFVSTGASSSSGATGKGKPRKKKDKSKLINPNWRVYTYHLMIQIMMYISLNKICYDKLYI